MTSRRTLLVIASVLVAALGTALIWLYVQGVETRARSEAQSSVELKPVLVVTKPAEAGTPASNLQLGQANVPVQLAAGALTPGQAPTGALVKGVEANAVLYATLLSPNAPSDVPKGLQAASITILDPLRVPALLKQGDDVAVYSYGERDPAPRLELEHAKVRAVGPDQQPAAAGTTPGSGVSPTIVTFVGKPTDMLTILKITTSGRSAAIIINGPEATPAR